MDAFECDAVQYAPVASFYVFILIYALIFRDRTDMSSNYSYFQ